MSARKLPNLVGQFIRQRREQRGLSQRALGAVFVPPVTTQFISNVERGVTPLPPHHVATLVATLEIGEAEFRALLEREYASRLAQKLGGQLETSVPSDIDPGAIERAYLQADAATQTEFRAQCERLLKVTFGSTPTNSRRD